MRQFYREHSIPMQALGAFITFIGAMAWMPLLFIMLWYFDEILIGRRGEGIHWFCWFLYWFMAFIKVVTWFLYSAMDIDQDGAE